MRMSVNIKRKDPRFDGDHPSWNVTVSGPAEVFTQPMRRTLFLAGLNELPGDAKEFAIWSSRPSIGSPQLAFAATLAAKFGAALKPETRDMVEAATRERLPADGLEKFLGRSKAQPAGDRPLAVVAGSRDFIANCAVDDEMRIHFLQGAGWLPIRDPSPAIEGRFGTLPFRTRDPFLASNLEIFMDEAAKLRMRRALAEAQVNIKTSKTQEPPADFDVPAPEGIDYLPFQKTGIQTVAKSGKSAIIADDMGLGKAQPLDAKILTPGGWRRMGDIRTGDLVIGSSGHPTKVLGVFPQGEKEIFRVTFNDGATVECCDEHLWEVNTPTRRMRGNPPRVLPLSEIRETLTDAAGNRRHYIPMVEPVTFPEASLRLDPYLLGTLLGNGCMTQHYTHLSTIDADMVAEVATMLPESLSLTHLGGCDYRIGSAHSGAPNLVRRALVSLGLAGKGSDTKFIPPEYLVSSIEQRASLLQGLLDTDGWISVDGLIQFSSNSIDLADGVSEIVMSLGGNARRSSKISASGKRHHIVTICLPDEIAPFRVERKSTRHRPRAKYRPTRAFAKVESIGVKPAQCIKVSASDHLYVTDDYVLTHNTIQGIGILNARPAIARAIVFCQANMKLKWVREIDKWRINSDLTVGYAEGKTWPDTDIVVINYDIAKNHLEKIRGTKWDLVIPDEAHSLKNEAAQRTQAVLGDLLAVDNPDMIPLAEGGQIVHLTGTPKPNRIAELWPLLTSTRPDIWGRGPEARQAFLNRYEPPTLIKKKMRRGSREFEVIIPMPGKPIRELELQLRLRGSGSFIRRMKRDTDLPPKFRTPIEMPFKLSKEDLALLREAEVDLERIAERSMGPDEMKLGRTREAGAIIDVIAGISPDSPNFQEIARVRRNLGVLKAPHAARFIVEELSDDDEIAVEDRRKTVVFAHHKEVIDVISAAAEAKFPGGVRVYDGRVSSAKKRQSHIDQFQDDPSVRLIILSLAGATGITLTAAARMRVVEPDWSPSNMVQIEDRIWRIGQEMNCDIGYLFVPNSLDVKMGLALIAKMETDERSINALSFRGMKAGSPAPKTAAEANPPKRKAGGSGSDAAPDQFAFQL